MSIKKTTEMVKQELKDKHGLVLVSEYMGAHQNITFLCKNGHSNIGTATNILQRGYKCKHCISGRPIISKLVWSSDLLNKVVSMVNAKISIKDIALALDTTEKAITSKLNIEKIKFSEHHHSEQSIESRLLDVLILQNRELVDYPENIKSTDYIDITCQEGHTATQLVANIIYKHNTSDCPICVRTSGSSKPELDIRQFIEENYTGWIEYNDRVILEGKELDIVIPDLGLAIEFNGAYWHSKVHTNYHQNKSNEVEDFGYQLIHISEYDWYHKQDIVKSRLLAKLNKARRIYARNTNVKQVPWNEIKLFLDQNHIQGAGQPTSTNFALLTDDEIVAVMTFGKPRFSSEDWELIRYCTKLGTTVVGGASKLFKRRPEGAGISYAARDYSTGNVYKKLGFSLSHRTEPGYAYYKNLRKISRYQAQKHKLEALLPLYDPKLTEHQNMQLNGYYRVYDSGNMVFTWHP